MTISLTPITDYWFDHPEYWFHSTRETDQHVYQHFISNLNFPFPSPPPGFEKVPANLPLEKILWYDQVYRHLCRYTGEPYPDWVRRYALDTSLDYLQTPETILDNLPPEYQCFMWLPLRHSDDPELLERALKWSVERHQKYPNIGIFRRFYYATVKRITLHSNNNFKKTLALHPQQPYNQSSPSHFSTLFDWRDLLDLESTYTHTRRPDITPYPFRKSSNKIDHSILNAWQKNYPRVVAKQTPLIISLSGGVDSMVCLYLAYRLGHPVTAIMINYNNRPESTQEQKLVQNWCDYLGVTLHVRVINEINRTNPPTLDREFYESHTREIRFWCYRILSQSYTLAKTQPDIVLGHNYDDTKENALNNIRKNIHLDNLAKMRPLEKIMSTTPPHSTITLSRPFLDVPKKHLVEFAHNHGLPYFIDSTPKWSERGRLRDTVIPTLEKYDPDIFRSLFSFSQNFADLTALVDSQIIARIWNSKTTTDTTITFKHYTTPCYYVWNKIINRLSIKASHKTIHTLIHRWKNYNSSSTQLNQINHLINSQWKVTITVEYFKFIYNSH